MRGFRGVLKSLIAAALGLASTEVASAQSAGISGLSAGTPALCAPVTARASASLRVAPTYSLITPFLTARGLNDTVSTTPAGHLGLLLQAQYRASRRLAIVAGAGPSLLLNSEPRLGGGASSASTTREFIWCGGPSVSFGPSVSAVALLQSHGLEQLPRAATTAQVWRRRPTVVPNLRVGF